MNSFREIAERMDPIRTPYRMGGTEPPSYDSIPDRDEWHQGGRRAYANASDLGLFHREEKGLLQMHRDATSYRDIVNRHYGSESRIHRCLFFNTFLIPHPASTQRHARAMDIGRMIGRRKYDILGLCETFDDDIKQLIRDRVYRGNHPEDTWDDEKGPGAIYTSIDPFNLTRMKLKRDSGLYVLTGGQERRIVSSERRAFRTPSIGVDELANKGWLRTEIDLGPGNIDLYFTHTNAGTPSGTLLNLGGDNNEEARRGQLQEIFDEIQSRREEKPENISLVVGDLNVYSGDNHSINLWTKDYKSEYMNFLDAIEATGLEDAWLTYGGKAGGTHAIWNEDDEEDTNICILDADCACRDYDPEKRGYKRDRLDYILVEKPRNDHSFMLDFARIRRRSFPRVKPCGDLWRSELGMFSDVEDKYMSDHVGLDVVMIAAPKNRLNRKH